ncbi:hypothetical protein [Trichocoleus sp. FACHB-262]|uniref:hypothetical protein n=1 Tax=Trichocoleus sp. FACHB-262 TaxID=2692869 RepID=UPI001682B0BE|nr:hypothetical protein [Trichocoleus sp. FACHB-262]MBD2123937.1 hypothetical protein [Trichocoleus sp. FACHB-262]
MTVKRFLRQATLTRRSHLTVFILSDEAAAFQAYRLLQSHGISPEHLAIVGKGYSSPERVGLLKPMQIATRKAQALAVFAGTVGSAISFIGALFIHFGLGFPLHANLVLMIVAGGVVSGFCGAVAGALLGFLGEGSTSGIYRHYLSQGRYLLMMEGPEKLVRRGQEVLSYYSTSKP